MLLHSMKEHASRVSRHPDSFGGEGPRAAPQKKGNFCSLCTPAQGGSVWAGWGMADILQKEAVMCLKAGTGNKVRLLGQGDELLEGQGNTGCRGSRKAGASGGACANHSKCRSHMHILQIVKTTLQQCTRLGAHRAPPLHGRPPPPGQPADSLHHWLMDVDLGAPSGAPRPFNDHQSYPLPSKEPYSTIPKSILASLLTLLLIRRALVRPDVRSWARRGDAPASGVKCTTSPNGTSSYIRPASSTAWASASWESVRSALQSARYKSTRKRYMR